MQQDTRTARTYQNLPAVIADELREAILNGERRAGEKLKQEEIAQLFNSSLIPVREALRNLEAEGLVTFYPNKGAFVSEISYEQVREIFETRIYIELGALALSIPNMTEAELAQAEAILDRMDTLESGKDLSDSNRDFHNILYSRCGNRFLQELINALHRNIERYMRQYLTDHCSNDLSQDTHRKILHAVRNRDVAAAQGFLETHMRTAMLRLMDVLRGHGF